MKIQSALFSAVTVEAPSSSGRRVASMRISRTAFPARRRVAVRRPSGVRAGSVFDNLLTEGHWTVEAGQWAEVEARVVREQQGELLA